MNGFNYFILLFLLSFISIECYNITIWQNQKNNQYPNNFNDCRWSAGIRIERNLTDPSMLDFAFNLTDSLGVEYTDYFYVLYSENNSEYYFCYVYITIQPGYNEIPFKINNGMVYVIDLPLYSTCTELPFPITLANNPGTHSNQVWETSDRIVYNTMLLLNLSKFLTTTYQILGVYTDYCDIVADSNSYNQFIITCHPSRYSAPDTLDNDIQIQFSGLQTDVPIIFTINPWFTPYVGNPIEKIIINSDSIESTQPRKDYYNFIYLNKPVSYIYSDSYIISQQIPFVFENDTTVLMLEYYYKYTETKNYTTTTSTFAYLDDYTFNISTSIYSVINVTNINPPTLIYQPDYISMNRNTYEINFFTGIEVNFVNYKILFQMYFQYTDFDSTLETVYPFGVVSNSEFNAYFQIPNYNMNVSIFLKDFDLQIFQNQSTTLNDNGQIDLLDVQYIGLNNNKMIILFTASSDSGIYLIDLKQPIGDLYDYNLMGKIRSYDISVGNYMNGTFELLIDYPILNGVPDFSLYSLTLGNLVRKDSFSNLKDQPYPDLPLALPTSELKNLTITSLRFAMNEIDLSDIGCNNTLYVTFSKTEKKSFIYFEISYYLNKVPYQGEWNDEFNAFAINFPLFARDFTQSIPFTIRYLGYEFHSYSLPAYGIKQELRVKSKIADKMPPMIIGFSSSPDQIVPDGGEVSWLLTIQDEYNGLKGGVVKIRSNIDILEYTIPIIPKSNIHLADYNISIKVPANCISQTYKIAYIELTDLSNYTSIYQLLDIDSPDQPISPFATILNSTYYLSLSTSFSCLYDPTDETPPAITQFTVSHQTIDVSLPNSNVEIQFTLTDSESPLSIRHTPICYLHALYFEHIFVPATISSNTSLQSISYLCQFNIPYGFGYPSEKLLISVHGYSDDKLNIGGVTGTHLLAASFQTDINITLSRSTPVITETNKYKENDTTLTIYGHNFINSTGVYVNGILFPTTFKQNTVIAITGTFPKNQFNVVVKIDDFTSNIFNINYKPFVPVNQPCPGTPQCGGPINGRCINSKCICISPWVGADCLSKNDNVTPPKVDPNSPNSDNINQNGFKSLITIISLNEYDFNDKLVKSHTFNSWKFSNTTLRSLTPNIQEYQYEASILSGNQNTAVTTTVQYFTQNQDIYFANEKLTLLPSTIKYKFSISKYSFQSSTNYLQLVLDASIESGESDSCSTQETQSDIQSDYFKLQVNSNSLYGRFVKRGVVDNRIIQLPSPKVLDSANEGTTSKTTIGINIPHFISNVVIDPDFSMLVETKPAQDKSGSTCSAKKSLSKAQIAGIVIGVVCFAAGAVAVVSYFIIKKKQYISEKNRIHKKISEFQNS